MDTFPNISIYYLYLYMSICNCLLNTYIFKYSKLIFIKLFFKTPVYTEILHIILSIQQLSDSPSLLYHGQARKLQMRAGARM